MEQIPVIEDAEKSRLKVNGLAAVHAIQASYVAHRLEYFDTVGGPVR